MNTNNKKENQQFFLPDGAEVSIIPVVQGEEQIHFDISEMPDHLPILALRNAVLFPGMIFPVTIGREKSIRLVKDVEKGDSFLGAVPQNDVTVEDPKASAGSP